jgi:hypothetical protein
VLSNAPLSPASRLLQLWACLETAAAFQRGNEELASKLAPTKLAPTGMVQFTHIMWEPAAGDWV